MTKKKNCNDCGACSHVDAKKPSFANIEDAYQVPTEEIFDYGFYSNVLKKPFERLEDLKNAEEAYFAEQKAKADKTTQKKADAQKVEDAFKALNAARRTYKESLSQLTQEYADELTNLKKAFELGKKDLNNTLASAEDAYAKALKEFTTKYENYHLTLKDGDFETTISGSQTKSEAVKAPRTYESIATLFDALFGVL